MGRRIQILAGGLVLVSVAFSATAQLAGESVSLRAPSENDVYAAGRLVEVLAPVAGDAVLAGQTVNVVASVAQDVIAAGETVSIRGPVGDDVRVAARDASLQGNIGGHLAAAAQTVIIDQAVTVSDWAWLAGEHVILHGNIGKELKAAGQTIRITGNIGGDAELVGGHIQIESGAVIGGDLTVRSEQEPEIDEGAKILGQVVQLPLPAKSSDAEEWEISGRVFFGVAVLLALLAYYWLFPQFARRVAEIWVAEPLKSLGLGVAAVAVSPLAIVILFATGVGFLLALPLGAVYLTLLLVGYLAGLYAVAHLLAHRTGYDVASRGIGALILTLIVVVVALVTLIPVLGPLVVFAIWLIGIGAVVVTMLRKYAQPAESSSA